MSIGIQIINQFYVPSIFPDFPEELKPFLEKSNPVFAGGYNGKPFCLVGIVPQLRSGTAGIWGWNTFLVADHPYIYARWAHRLIKRVHTLYPVINGECSLDKISWLASLGATFPLSPKDNMIFFQIEAPQ